MQKYIEPGIIFMGIRAMKQLLATALLLGMPASEAAAKECPDDAVTFNFSNLPVRQAFAIFANIAGVRPQVDPSIDQSEPMHYECVDWHVIAEDLATRHGLEMQIKNGVMYVRKK
jgi:hypothetical protein